MSNLTFNPATARYPMSPKLKEAIIATFTAAINRGRAVQFSPGLAPFQPHETDVQPWHIASVQAGPRFVATADEAIMYFAALALATSELQGMVFGQIFPDGIVCFSGLAAEVSHAIDMACESQFFFCKSRQSQMVRLTEDEGFAVAVARAIRNKAPQLPLLPPEEGSFATSFARLEELATQGYVWTDATTALSLLFKDEISGQRALQVVGLQVKREQKYLSLYSPKPATNENTALVLGGSLYLQLLYNYATFSSGGFFNHHDYTRILSLTARLDPQKPEIKMTAIGWWRAAKELEFFFPLEALRSIAI